MVKNYFFYVSTQWGVEKEVIEVTVTVIDENYFKVSTDHRDKCFYETLDFVVSEKILCERFSEKEFKAMFLVSDLQCCRFETIVCFRNEEDLKVAVLNRSLTNKSSNFDLHTLIKYAQLTHICNILNL